MTREQELLAEIERLQAELQKKPTPFVRIGGKDQKIMQRIGIGGRNVNIKTENGWKNSYAKTIPVIVVSDAE